MQIIFGAIGLKLLLFSDSLKWIFISLLIFKPPCSSISFYPSVGLRIVSLRSISHRTDSTSISIRFIFCHFVTSYL